MRYAPKPRGRHTGNGGWGHSRTSADFFWFCQLELYATGSRCNSEPGTNLFATANALFKELCSSSLLQLAIVVCLRFSMISIPNQTAMVVESDEESWEEWLEPHEQAAAKVVEQLKEPREECVEPRVNKVTLMGSRCRVESIELPPTPRFGVDPNFNEISWHDGRTADYFKTCLCHTDADGGEVTKNEGKAPTLPFQAVPVAEVLFFVIVINYLNKNRQKKF